MKSKRHNAWKQAARHTVRLLSLSLLLALTPPASPAGQGPETPQAIRHSTPQDPAPVFSSTTDEIDADGYRLVIQPRDFASADPFDPARGISPLDTEDHKLPYEETTLASETSPEPLSVVRTGATPVWNPQTALPDLGGEDPDAVPRSLQHALVTETASLLGVPAPLPPGADQTPHRPRDAATQANATPQDATPFRSVLDQMDDPARGPVSQSRDLSSIDPRRVAQDRIVAWGQNAVRESLTHAFDASGDPWVSTLLSEIPFHDLGHFDPVRLVQDRALAWGQNAVNASAESWFSGFAHHARARLNFHFDSDGNISGEGDVFLPLYDTPRTLVFTQIGARNMIVSLPEGEFSGLQNDKNRWIGNFGLGQRWFPKATEDDSGDWMFGYNVFIDHDFTRAHNRGGIGVEFQHDWLRLSSNVYIPLSQWKTSPDFDFRLVEERPARGWDARVEATLPFYRPIAFTGGYRQWFGDKVDISEGELREDPKTWSYGIKYTPFPLLTGYVTQQKTEGGKRETAFGLNLTYQFDMPWHRQISPGQVAALRTVQGARYDFVNRENRMPLAYRAKEGAYHIGCLKPRIGEKNGCEENKEGENVFLFRAFGGSDLLDGFGETAGGLEISVETRAPTQGSYLDDPNDGSAEGVPSWSDKTRRRGEFQIELVPERDGNSDVWVDIRPDDGEPQRFVLHGTATVTNGNRKLNDYVTAPVACDPPDTAPIDNEQYTGTVAWKNGVADHTGLFEGKVEYTAIVTLTAKSGWTFDDLTTSSFTYTGAKSGGVSFNTSTKEVTIVFPPTEDFVCSALPFSDTKAVDGTINSVIDLIQAAKNENSLRLRLAKIEDESVALVEKEDLTESGLTLQHDADPTSPKEVVIDGGGRVVDLTGAPTNPGSPLITVGKGVTLKLTNITFKGLFKDPKNKDDPNDALDTTDNTAPIIKVLTGGALVLDTGVVLKENKNTDSNGGGVNVEGGTLTMKAGAVISDNYGTTGKTVSGGGGVYVASGTFNMEGGSIVRNGGTQGGGVHMTGGKFNMSGGVIGRNDLLQGAGGGVDVRDGEFIMSGNAVISYNTAGWAGGGVHLDGANAKFTMSDNAVISYNIADYAGGGVYLDGANAKFTMNDNAEISNNTGGWNGGGGVIIYSGKFIMNGGAISGNSAGADSGGVGAWDVGEFTMKGGIISGNSAPQGGGVGVGTNAAFTKRNTGGTIYGSLKTDGTSEDSDLKNTATGDGNNNGHAVYWAKGSKKRDTTVGPTDSIDTTQGGPAEVWD